MSGISQGKRAEPPNVAFGMAVFNGDHILQAVLESIYPYASQICIAEGPVEYFATQGFTASTDRTVEVIETFPDPHDKIRLVQGQWLGEDEMVSAYVGLVAPQSDYIWHINADEIFRIGDIGAVLGVLPKYDSVGFRALSFFGSFDHILMGPRVEFTCIERWATPRRAGRHLSCGRLAGRGIFMYRYRYAFPKQVRQAVEYYCSVAPGQCMDDYYERVYKLWVLGDEAQRKAIEDKPGLVPSLREPCQTERFVGEHPVAIAKRLTKLRYRLRSEL